MLFKSKAPEKDKNAAANAAEVNGKMVQQQHSVVEPVAASPPVPQCMARPCGTRWTSEINERESCINVSGL